VTTFNLGTDPHEVHVLLTRNGDFRTTLTQAPEEDPPDWAVGTTITLVLGTHSYPFTISGPDATLVIDKAVVNTLIEERITRAYLYYNEGTADEVWALGDVIARG
jgi:hypothetical protein